MFSIGLVAISHDEEAVQRAFMKQHGITVPIVSDPTSTSFHALGILNPASQPGDPEYGLPYPGAWEPSWATWLRARYWGRQ